MVDGFPTVKELVEAQWLHYSKATPESCALEVGNELAFDRKVRPGESQKWSFVWFSPINDANIIGDATLTDKFLKFTITVDGKKEEYHNIARDMSEWSGEVELNIGFTKELFVTFCAARLLKYQKAVLSRM